MINPTIVFISGPQGSYKTRLAKWIQQWGQENNIEIYVEDGLFGANRTDNKAEAEIHVITHQISSVK